VNHGGWGEKRANGFYRIKKRGRYRPGDLEEAPVRKKKTNAPGGLQQRGRSLKGHWFPKNRSYREKIGF